MSNTPLSITLDVPTKFHPVYLSLVVPVPNPAPGQPPLALFIRLQDGRSMYHDDSLGLVVNQRVNPGSTFVLMDEDFCEICSYAGGGAPAMVGSGDHVRLEIGTDGLIKDWKVQDLEPRFWRLCD